MFRVHLCTFSIDHCTNDCRSIGLYTTFVMISDDTAILTLLNDFVLYHSYLFFCGSLHFSSWCNVNFLHLNVFKTKEMRIAFRCNRTVISPIVINGDHVEQVDSF